MNQPPFKLSEKYPLKKAITYADGAIVSKIVMKSDTGNVTLFAFDKDQYLSEHTAPFNAMIQVIEGQVMVTISKAASELTEGDMIIMPANIPHSVHASLRCKFLLTMLRG